MTVLKVIETARAMGIDIQVDEGDLLLDAAAPPPKAVVAMVVQNKRAIIALLKSCPQPWQSEDWKGFFDERAAILTFDGGHNRVTAERIAFGDTCDRWLIAHPPLIGEPKACLHCGRGVKEGQGVPVALPGESVGPVVLHSACASRWQNLRRAKARTTLEWLLVPKANMPL